jgi:streptogramin lyase
MAEAHDGSLWVATQSSGVRQIKDGRVVASYAKKDGLSGDAVRAIHQGSDGALWIGARDGGLNRLEGGRITVFTTREGLAHDGITAIRETRDGSLWIGAISGGLTRLEKGRFRVYTTKDGLPGDDILALWPDGEGALWIGTSRGLGRFRGGQLTRYTKRQGLCDDLVLSIVEDRSGSLWLGSNKGICQLAKAQIDAFDQGRLPALSPRLYTTADGLRAGSTGVHQNGAWRGSDGRLWFASGKGVGVIDPAPAPVKPETLPVYVEEFRVDKRRAAALPQPPSHGELEFAYTALDLRHPERVAFKYRLEGFDQDWTSAGKRRTAYYTNIPPGSYRFRVVASSDEGFGPAAEAALAFELRPHFYQTPWFRTLGVVLVVAGGFGAYRLRLRQLRAREKELARRVEEGLAQIKVLSGLLPICAWCKKVRDDQGYWNQIETFIRDRTDAEFSHGICPDCLVRVKKTS